MQNQNRWIIIVLLVSGILGFTTSLYVHRQSLFFKFSEYFTDESVIPTFHSPVSFVKRLAGDPQAGKKIFKEFCAACHAENPLIEVNAPRINDKKVWDALRKVGMSQLLKITINGLGAMPARGGCFECSDDQLKEVIHYILLESEK